MALRTLVATAALAGAAAAVTVLLSPPLSPRRAGMETLLVVLPGAFVPGREYVNIAAQIQGKAQLPLWTAVIADFTSDFPSLPEVTVAFEDAVEAARSAGFTGIQNSDVWGIGHSQGGYVGSEVVRDTYGGHILMGSYLAEEPTQALREYPKPVLHLAGDLDGLAQITRLAEEYVVPRELLLAGDERTAVLAKPVLFFQGMNHAQMGNGYVTDALRTDDFKPELTLEAATDLLATYAAAFLDAHRSANASGAAYALLLDQLIASEIFVRFFLDATQADVLGTWCTSGQRLVANLRTDVADRLDVGLVAYTDVDLFVESKPTVTVNGSRATVVTTAYLERVVEAKSEGQYGYELDCKFKSQEAIVDALELAADQYGVEATCADVGEYLYQIARGSVAPWAAARHAAIGKPITFLPDFVHGTGSDWAPSHVNYTDTAATLFVTASALPTANGIPVIGGMSYCKGINVARIAAWILHNSLPRGLDERQ